MCARAISHEIHKREAEHEIKKLYIRMNKSSTICSLDDITLFLNKVDENVQMADPSVLSN